MSDAPKATVKQFQDTFAALEAELGKAIIGHREIIRDMLICFFAGGNLLIESSPGLGKTLLVKTLSRVVDLKFSRIQFTPDLMPADIIGTNIVAEGADGKRYFEFQKGPVFTQLLLADEINRATPKTQSALLEAMQERRVTVAGKTVDLEQPYFVIATQNPQDTEGTYSMPEAQLDRFFFKLRLEKPGIDSLRAISQQASAEEDAELRRVCGAAEAEALKALVLSVEAPKALKQYAIKLILLTHPSSEMGLPSARKFLRYGSSPRGVQALILGAKVRALIDGRMCAEAKDVASVARQVLGHRLMLNFEGEAGNVTSRDLIEEALKAKDLAEVA
ncbi:MAG TPA: AAA family ATPase [Planctomycetota bacterium]|jgi:MoxR-like ATPase